MKTFNIILSLTISIILWFFIFIIIIIPKIYPYHAITNYNSIQSAIEDEKGCVILNNEEYNSSLKINSYNIIIKGDIKINGSIYFYNMFNLIIEGSLTVENLYIKGNDADNYSKIYNYGNLTVKNNFKAYKFTNWGKADIKNCKVCNCQCFGNSITNIENLEYLSTQTYNHIYLFEKSNLSIKNVSNENCSICNYSEKTSINSPKNIDINVKDNINIEIYYSPFHNKYFRYYFNIAYKTPIFIYFIVFGIIFLSAFLCALIVNRRKKVYLKSCKKSYFNGNIFKYILFRFLYELTCILSFNLLKPYADEYYKKWIWKNTIFHNYNMNFIGKGNDIFYKNMLWTFLNIVTFGVFYLWSKINYLKWRTKNIKFYGFEDKDSFCFKGKTKDLFCLVFNFVILYSFTITFIYIVVKGLLQISINSLPMLIIAIISIIVFLVFIFVLSINIIKHIFNDYYIHFIWENVKVNNNNIVIELNIKEISLKIFYKYFLLSIATLGGYAFVIDYKLHCDIIKRLN